MLQGFIIAISIGGFIGILNHIKNFGFKWSPLLLVNIGYASLSSLLAVAAFADHNAIDKVVVLSIIGGYIGEALIKGVASKFIDQMSEVDDVNLELTRNINEGEDNPDKDFKNRKN